MKHIYTKNRLYHLTYAFNAKSTGELGDLTHEFITKVKAYGRCGSPRPYFRHRKHKSNTTGSLYKYVSLELTGKFLSLKIFVILVKGCH